MGKQYPIISLITEEKILDEKTLQSVVEKHQETGQSLIGILKQENLLDDDQLTKVIAATSRIEFVNLSPEMVDPMAAQVDQPHGVRPVAINR